MKIYDCLEFLNCSWMEVIRYNYLVRSHFQNILELVNFLVIFRVILKMSIGNVMGS